MAGDEEVKLVYLSHLCFACYIRLRVIDYILCFEFQMERKSEGQILVNEIISQLKTKEVRIFISLKRFHKTFSNKR